MKKIIAAALVLLSTSAFASPDPISRKVLLAFEQAFRNPGNVVWTDYKDHYQVDFKQNDIDTRISYNKKGQIIGSFRYYYGSQLPILIQAKLQELHPDKRVFGVTEVSDGSNVRYFIILETEKKWYHVAADNYGDMTLDKIYNKA